MKEWQKPGLLNNKALHYLTPIRKEMKEIKVLLQKSTAGCIDG